MWLIRFHLIEPRDYNRITRILDRAGHVPRKLSGVLLVKGVILSLFGQRSWRTIASELGASHISLHTFYRDILGTPELGEILRYCIDRGMLLFIENERSISLTLLESEEIRELSKKKLEEMFFEK